MGHQKEALVFIPGIGTAPMGDQLEKFCQGLASGAERFEVAVSGEVNLLGSSGLAITARKADGNLDREFHCFECYWNDLVPNLDSLSSTIRMRQGFSLLWYWVFSGIWRLLFRKNIWITSAILFSAAFLFLWYLPILALGIGTIDELTKDQAGLLRHLVEPLKILGLQLESLDTWLGISVIISFLGLGRLANMSHFSRLYLTDKPLRDATRNRAARVLRHVLRDPEYQQVTVVSHSFGAIIAIDMLADIEVPKASPRLRAVTLGSPLLLLRSAEPWIGVEVKKLLQRQDISAWVDMFAPTDFFAANDDQWIKNVAGAFPYQPIRLPQLGSLWQQVSGATHKSYFYNQILIDTLLEPTS